MKDAYRTIQGKTEARQKVQRSDFLAIALPIVDEAGFMNLLESVRKKHHDAAHHCWAFRLFAPQRTRSSDAGEPSGSAGKPILSTIEAADLHDVGVIVVRWFGGVKLGTGGLSRAYRSTAAVALEAAAATERYIYQRIAVVPFDRLNEAYRLIESPSIVLVGETYGAANVFDFDVRLSRVDDFRRRLVERRLTLQ